MSDTDTKPASAARPEVRAFWTGPELSPYEHLSLLSFVATDARVLLYSNDTTLRVPDGVEVVDVRELLTEQVHQFTYADGDRSAALHADLFRYVALLQHGGWYADLDIICTGDRLPNSKVYIARETDDMVNGAVLKFPAQSPVMATALEESWRLLPEARDGAPIKARISIGPALLTRLADELSFDHLVLPRSRAYEIGYDEIPAMFDPMMTEELEERVATSDFIHLWNEIWRRTRIPKSYGPPVGSLLDKLFKRVGMTFSDEARLSAQAVATWFRERQLLTQVNYHLQTETVPANAFNLLRARLRGDARIEPAVPAKRPHVAPDGEVIRTFWQGGPLGAYQQLALKSFADRGCRVEVYTYDVGLGVPDWIDRRDAAEIIPQQRVLRWLEQDRRAAINAGLFRIALLHRLGGWWIDPDVILLRPALPAGDVFWAAEADTASTAALKLPVAHPALVEALIQSAAFEDDVTRWDDGGALLAAALRQSDDTATHPIGAVSPIAWTDVLRLFDPEQAESVAAATQMRSFLDLHTEAWLRAGIPRYLGPPPGSYLDALFRKHDVGLIFPAFMEFDDVRRWVTHMMGSFQDTHR